MAAPSRQSPASRLLPSGCSTCWDSPSSSRCGRSGSPCPRPVETALGGRSRVLAQVLAVLMRALHLLAAAVWVGGSVLYLAVIAPALRAAQPGPAVGASIAALFRRLVNVCI